MKKFKNRKTNKVFRAFAEPDDKHIHDSFKKTFIGKEANVKDTRKNKKSKAKYNVIEQVNITII